MNQDQDYDTWHQCHEIDDDINTPWHRFVTGHYDVEQDIAGKTILEIGCGRGGFSNHLARLVPSPRRIFACDFSESALRMGENRYGHPAITWKKEDIMALSFSDNSFDTAISCETIEHVPDSKQALNELYRVIKPGGTLFLTCPNYFNLFGIWCIYRWMIGKPFTEGGQPYVHYLLAANVRRWFRHAGFKMEKCLSSEIIIPARVPRHFYKDKAPSWLNYFGFRTFYVLKK
jgi:2-polyprenyl-3-methyl-5-hydroxy-6-metoxy-1,4-benzoquinol methylase